MTAVLILALAVLAFFAFLFFQVWRRYARSGESAQLVPVDLEAFENLTDHDEERYLRTMLRRAEFRGVQRTRIRAAKMYVAALSANASVLMAAGQSARDHADPQTAASGQEIIQRAIRLKVWCMFSLIRLNVALVFPARLSPPNAIAAQYAVVKYLVANLPRRLAA